MEWGIKIDIRNGGRKVTSWSSGAAVQFNKLESDGDVLAISSGYPDVPGGRIFVASF